VSAYLTKSEVDLHVVEIQSEFERLLKSRRFAPRPSAKQWDFFRHSFKVLTGVSKGDFPCTRQQAIQYKFEVSDRLRRYYLLPGDPVRFIFTLVDKERESMSGYEEYPCANEYMLLVTRNVPALANPEETRAILERVITDAVDAEWAVYLKLPEFDVSPLKEIFDSDGSAYKRIYMTAEAHHKKEWTIANPHNPSTRRLIDIKVGKVTSDIAQVRTQEYWYLRWWSMKKNKYVYIYNEVNRQIYYLIKRGDSWLVKDNAYPPAKTSTPRRWRRK
jgi:hypothetical protein